MQKKLAGQEMERFWTTNIVFDFGFLPSQCCHKDWSSLKVNSYLVFCLIVKFLLLNLPRCFTIMQLMALYCSFFVQWFATCFLAWRSQVGNLLSVLKKCNNKLFSSLTEPNHYGVTFTFETHVHSSQFSQH